MQTDSEAIERSAENPPAFGVLFERHARTVHGYLARRAGRDIADEVLSEVFLVAFERRSAFDTRASSARPWLLGIATVLLRSYAKREAKHLRTAARAAENEAHDGGLDGAINRQDAVRRLQRMLEHLHGLPAIDRDVLLLYAWGELTYEDIAKSLDIPIGTVRSRLNRVRRRLRETESTTEEQENRHERPRTAAGI